MNARINYENTSDTVYDPGNSLYWDVDSTDRELARAFDLCNGCRMCFKYCPSFPTLFQLMDEKQDVFALSAEDKDKIVGECYQCKICYVKCPYTDRDHHKFNLDYPALLQRAVHVKARKEGVPFRDKFLANSDFAGKTAGLLSGLANKAMKSNFHRRIMEAILGIHRNKRMPEFHSTSFMRWFKKKPAVPVQAGQEKVVLFSTCFVNYNNPQLGRDTVEVLEKNQVHVDCPEQNCCGMPGLNSGDLDWAISKMKKNVESLYPYAKEGYRILAINPTCSLTLKKEYVSFLPPELKEKAQAVASATMDVHEYLFELKKQEKFNRDFKSSPGKVGYHVPCHLRAQNIGYRSRDILRLIPGAEIAVVDECCGHNGTWAMKEEYFEMSLEAGKRAFDGLKEKEASHIATDCPLAAIQIEQGMGLGERPDHPVQILARAYRKPEDGGFPDAISSDENGKTGS